MNNILIVIFLAGVKRGIMIVASLIAIIECIMALIMLRHKGE